VQQVVENLLENARKYSPDGGVIRLAVRQEDGGVVIEVQDHGRGIVSEALERIFAPFERGGQPGQGEPHIEGMGLGLYVSRSVMSALGGRIWATHGEEGGSIFSIWLPQEKKPDM
jgi:signal transduction histidine kinase